MTKQNDTSKYIEKKLSKRADLKIRGKLFGMFLGKLMPQPQFGMKLAFSSLALIAIVIGGATWFPNYVYNSETIVRGDTFYTYKRNLEKKQLASLTNPAHKSKYYLNLSDRRLQEAHIALTKNSKTVAEILIPKAYADFLETTVYLKDSIPATLLSESAHFVSLSMNEAEKVKDIKVAQELLKEIDRTIEKQEKILDEVFKKSEDTAVVRAAVAVENVNSMNEMEVETYINKIEDDFYELEEEFAMDLDPVWVETMLDEAFEDEDFDGIFDDFAYELEELEAYAEEEDLTEEEFQEEIEYLMEDFEENFEPEFEEEDGEDYWDEYLEYEDEPIYEDEFEPEFFKDDEWNYPESGIDYIESDWEEDWDHNYDDEDFELEEEYLEEEF